jgi:hypothetical protein
VTRATRIFHDALTPMRYATRGNTLGAAVLHQRPGLAFSLWSLVCSYSLVPFHGGGARTEIQYISSAPSVLTPIRLLPFPTTSHKVYTHPVFLRGFVVLGLNRVLKGAKFRVQPMVQPGCQYSRRDSMSGVTSGTKFHRIISKC